MCHDVFSDLLLGFNLCCQVWEEKDLKCCQSALLYNISPSSIVFDDDYQDTNFKIGHVGEQQNWESQIKDP